MAIINQRGLLRNSSQIEAGCLDTLMLPEELAGELAEELPAPRSATPAGVVLAGVATCEPLTTEMLGPSCPQAVLTDRQVHR